MNNSESSSATVPKTPLAEQNGPVEQMIEKNVDESELQFGESAHPAGDNSIAVAGRNHVKTSLEPGIPDGDVDHSLPETAILLTTEWGSKVYIVGTTHFSRESQEDVANVIQMVQPHCVVLELCESRSYMLGWEEDEILKEAEKMDFRVMTNVMKRNGFWQGAMYLILLSVSSQITRELGMAPGGEFRRAAKEAQNVPNCMIYLADRPIEITLRRALASLSWWQLIKLSVHLLFNKDPIKKEDVEKCKNKDFLAEIIEQLAGEFPELKKVFVNERDIFLTYGLRNASMSISGPHGVEPCRVVGVVGIGHLAGIQANWDNLSYKDIPAVLKIPPQSKTSKVIRFTLKASLFCFALYGVHQLTTKSFNYLTRS